jgi:drug/metabolite transporter (DMT)-like permease
MSNPYYFSIVLKLLSCFFASCMVAIVRHLSDDLSAYQLTFFRALVGLIFFLPWIIKSWPNGVKTKNWPLQITRTFLSLIAMTLFFIAIQHVPLATATSLSFVTPIFTAIFAILWLKESSDARKWEGLMMGFVGAIIIIRPGAEGFNAYALLVIVSALCWANVTIAVKKLTKTDSTGTISALMMMLSVPMALPMAVATWQPVEQHHIIWLIGMGGAAALAQYLFVKAFSLADVVKLIPIGFSRLIFITVIAYFAFDEIPDFWTLIGSGVIILSVLYSTYHNVKKTKDA